MDVRIEWLKGAPVALSDDGALFVYNLLPVGRFVDKRYGEVRVDGEMLRRMESNFGRYPAYEVPVKIGHGDGAPSPGKVIAVKARPDGLEITLTVDKEAAEAINNRHYRYLSAEFDENYTDKATGGCVGPVLLGAALVNQPADPFVQPLVFADGIEENVGEEAGAGKTDGGERTMPELMELLRNKLSEARAREAAARKEYDAGIKAAGDEAAAAKAAEEKARKTIAELEAKNARTEKARAKTERERRKNEVEAFCDLWSAQGVPPAALKKLRPVLLAEENMVRLSDSEPEKIPLLRLLGEVFEAMPKVDMGRRGLADAGDPVLSEAEKARAKGAAMAATANRKGR